MWLRVARGIQLPGLACGNLIVSNTRVPMEEVSNTTKAIAPVRRPRLWPWFIVGFLLVFVGLLLFFTRILMHPSGAYAVEYPLWRYYGSVIPRLFGVRYLGPATVNDSYLLPTVAFHLLLSAGGGCVALGLGWLIRRLRNR